MKPVLQPIRFGFSPSSPRSLVARRSAKPVNHQFLAHIEAKMFTVETQPYDTCFVMWERMVRMMLMMMVLVLVLVLVLVMVFGHFHHKHLLNAQWFPGQAVAGLSQDARVQEMSSFVASRGGGETARFCLNSHGIPWVNQAWQWKMAHSCIHTYIYIYIYLNNIDDLPIQNGDVHSYVRLPEGNQVRLFEWNITYTFRIGFKMF